MEGQFFTSTEAANITQCSRRQLQYWRERGVVVPSVNTTGKGRNVYYSLADLLALTAMKYLLSVGLSFDVCRTALNSLRKAEPSFFDNPFSYRSKKRFMLWQPAPEQELDLTEFDEKEAIAAVKSGRTVIPFWTENLREKLHQTISGI